MFKILGVLARTGPSSKVSLTMPAAGCEVDPSCCARAGPPCRSTTAITPSTSAKPTVASNASGELPWLLTLLLEGIRSTLIGTFMLTTSFRQRAGACLPYHQERPNLRHLSHRPLFERTNLELLVVR